MTPLTDNPLRTRSDLQQAVRRLVAPLNAHTSPAGARVIPGEAGATYGTGGAGLEGFARRLWGLAPLAASGGAYDGWARIRAGLIAGTDPEHPEYWGDPYQFDIHLVEMASLGTALVLAKPQVWDPLPASAKQNVERYLRFANSCNLVNNNWQFFRVLANLGLESVGVEPDDRAVEGAIDRIETMYLGDGWYTDGHVRQRDYYIAFAMHFYALFYAKSAKRISPSLASAYKERAAIFAKDFAHWFTAAGAALPYGRSLTYRFAQGAFWGALAYADVEALPWGQIKGLFLRHIRHWAAQPIFTTDGVLSLGYGYPNLIMTEQYNAPGSPYWALKSCLPLALAEDHPFWRASEAPLEGLNPVRVMPHPGMVVCRDDEDDHVVALTGGQWAISWPMRQTESKYSKFAYSTAFGFCVDAGQVWADSMLVFSETGRNWVGRTECVEHRADPQAQELYSRWRPMPQVEVETTLRPHGKWHERVHRVRVGRRIHALEGGFAANAGEGNMIPGRDTHVGDHHAVVHGVGGSSGIVDVSRNRTPEVSSVEPNANVLYPRAQAPLLRATLEPGEYVFTTLVLGTVSRERFEAAWRTPPG